MALNGPWVVTVEGPSGTRELSGVRLNEALRPTGPVRVMWLRAEVKIDGTVAQPALMVSPRAAGCQIYVNGVKAGDCSQGAYPNYSPWRGLLVPLKPDASTLDVAIRLEQPASMAAGVVGLGSGGVLLGATPALVDHRSAEDLHRILNLLPQVLLCVVELLGGTLLLVVFAFERRSREYLWFGVFLWLDGSCSLYSVFARVYPLMPTLGNDITDVIGLMLRYIPLMEFLAAFTMARMSRWVRDYEAALLCWAAILIGWFVLGHAGVWYRMHSTLAELLAAQLPFDIGSLAYLFWRWRGGDRGAGLLLPSFLLANGIELLGLTVPMFGQAFHVGPFSFDYDDLSMLFFLLSIGPVIFWQYRRVTLEYARTTAELAAGREIQQQLVQQTLPEVAGCSVAAVYLPAAEVGGDFYQVFPQKDGSMLLVVGDVSGKGLKAAMRGTLAIGALQSMMQERLQPSAILARLNQQLAASGDGGFITCLCVRFEPNETMTVSNAGHLPPYCNGDEIELSSGLPLGIFAAAEYSETTVQLKAGDQLMFLSDGVVEARNASGELFGFERTREISGRSAEEIALAAREFGQEDDITVLTVTLPGATPA